MHHFLAHAAPYILSFDAGMLFTFTIMMLAMAWNNR